jgi:hypothetical protein
MRRSLILTHLSTPGRQEQSAQLEIKWPRDKIYEMEKELIRPLDTTKPLLLEFVESSKEKLPKELLVGYCNTINLGFRHEMYDIFPDLYSLLSAK